MLKILMVDDSVFSQKVAANLLKKVMGDIEISFANDGEQGYLAYKEIKPDFVFLDLLMPKINGQDLIYLLKKFDADAKIFVVSADVQKNVREEIDKCNILAFVNKPFTEEKAQLVANIMKENAHE